MWGIADEALDKLFEEHRLKHPPTVPPPTALADAYEQHERDMSRWLEKYELHSVEFFDGGFSEHWRPRKEVTT